MAEKQTAVQQLSEILDSTGYNYITEYGYNLLRDNGMVTSQQQAKIMAQLMKDVCSAAFADGRAVQAFKDGYNAGNGDPSGL